MAEDHDVLIVGGGIAGLSLASALAGNCTVALIEAEPELAYHSSSRSARQLIPSYGPPVVRELTARTLELMAARDNELPEPVLTPSSFMLIGAGDEVAAEASGQMRPIGPAAALELCPALVPGTFAAAGLDTGSFGCNTVVLLADHLRRARAAGADIITGAQVRSARRLNNRWRIEAGARTLQAGILVNAAGAWADELAGLCGVGKLGLQPYRRTAAIAVVERPLPPQCPMVAAADGTFYFRPEGGDVLISPSESVPSAPEDARVRPGDVADLVRRLNQLTTLGIKGIRRAWTGLRTEAADGVPVAGFDAGSPGFYWLAGQGGYGFQTSSAIAELAAGQILAAGGQQHGPVSRTARALAATRPAARR